MSNQLCNQLIIMSDEHTRKVLGCYGNTVVRTPNLDRLAARGTRFENAYTPVPICVPARATFATGQYGHQTGHWDNATPYYGKPNSWGHHLQAAGIEVGSIGKLHYRNAEDRVGLDFQVIPMHVVNGVGDVLGCVREPLPKRWKSHAMAEKIGAGETNYTEYDRDIAERSAAWLRKKATEKSPHPWVLFVSMVAPHFPLIAPKEFYDIYADKGLMPSKPEPEADHPWLAAMRDCVLYDNFTPERTHIALTAYYGLVSFMDANVGKILDALKEAGLSETTQVVYTSDHGDNIGERGLWGKSNMYEESVGVPMILAGPNIPSGHVCHTPVSLLDIAPTVLKTAGVAATQDNLSGQSLAELAALPDALERTVISEYHAMGSLSGAFMVRKGRWKLIYYHGFEPQLFDLFTDPEELTDLGQDPKHVRTRAELLHELTSVCDPNEVDIRAKADQKKIVEEHGGIDHVVKKGGFGATPPPGSGPAYS